MAACILCLTVSRLKLTCPELFCLLHGSSEVFPRGLPEVFTLTFTLALKKTALRDTFYLFQISDQQGYPQVLLSQSCASPLSHFPLFPFPLSLPRSLSPPLLLYTHRSRLPSPFCTVIHNPLRFIFFPCDTFSILSLSRCLLSSPVLCLPVSPVALPSIIRCSPLSCTFIAIHVRSVMKRPSSRKSP